MLGVEGIKFLIETFLGIRLTILSGHKGEPRIQAKAILRTTAPASEPTNE